jgi:endonuclease-3
VTVLKSERTAFVLKRLKELYPETPTPLKHNSIYELLIAVLLSAQCTDERVNKVTPALFEQANTPFDMQNVPLEIIYKIIRPCGLAPKKSSAILKLSKILVGQYDGVVPETFEKLEALPGVGHKTAGVVMSQGFGYPAFPVDTHIHRLAQRWGLTKKGSNVVQTERDLKSAFPESEWNKLHLQIIFYGREFCSARGCDGRICEICTTCYPNRKHPFKIKKG